MEFLIGQYWSAEIFGWLCLTGGQQPNGQPSWPIVPPFKLYVSVFLLFSKQSNVGMSFHSITSWKHSHDMLVYGEGYILVAVSAQKY